MIFALAILAATPIVAFALLIGLCVLVVLREGSAGLGEVSRVIESFRLHRLLTSIATAVNAVCDATRPKP